MMIGRPTKRRRRYIVSCGYEDYAVISRPKSTVTERRRDGERQKQRQKQSDRDRQTAGERESRRVLNIAARSRQRQVSERGRGYISLITSFMISSSSYWEQPSKRRLIFRRSDWIQWMLLGLHRQKDRQRDVRHGSSTERQLSTLLTSIGQKPISRSFSQSTTSYFHRLSFEVFDETSGFVMLGSSMSRSCY